MWPVKSEANFESAILENTLVLGYEDWMILDMITYVSTWVSVRFLAILPNFGGSPLKKSNFHMKFLKKS
jgi:hypothetical protein